MYPSSLSQLAPSVKVMGYERGLALFKILALLLELSRSGLVLWLRFPRLQPDQKLKEIQRWACKVLQILQVEVLFEGVRPTPGASLVVANHVSWLDILVLQSQLPGLFVAKAEVRRWPLIGSMAQVCSTIFVERSSRQSARTMVEDTLKALGQGYSVVAFPEGTSSDGSDLGVFHANIFEAAIQARTPVQPVTLGYFNVHTGLPDDTVLFIGDTTLVASLRKVMASSSIKASVHFGGVILPQGHTRKSLALQAQQSIRRQVRLPRQRLS